ncbi:MAG: transketolase family protein, partial [Clostridia bacterium]|nr:transketolase family protein [Clostridia bacterium]
PLDEELIKEYAAKTGYVVTAEEHNVIGGLGDAVISALSESACAKVAKLGVNDVFGTSAPAGVLLEYYNLTANGIAEKVKALLNK